jgi:outer membrane receptor protein involved in Fe transport
MTTRCWATRFAGVTSAAAALAVVASPVAHAADPAPASEDSGSDSAWLTRLSLEELTQIEVNVPTKLGQPVREAPSVGGVITREQIASYGWLSLNDVLYRQPGFVPAQDYERPTVAARGLYEGWNNNHLLMLVDGVPINNVSNGTAYTWEVFPLFMVERAEIFRGPGSALYGTNATNGVVALHTRTASNLRPIEAAARIGNANTQTYDLFGGYNFSWATVTAGYNHFRTAGNSYESLDASGRTDAAGQPQTFSVNDRRASHFAFAKVTGNGALTGLSAQAHYQYWSFQTGHGWLYVVPDEDEKAINSEARVWLTYHPPALLDQRLEMEYVVQHQRHIKDYRIKFFPNGARFAGIDYPAGIVEYAKSNPIQWFARAQAQYRLWGEARVLLGLEDSLIFSGQGDTHAANADIDTGGSYQPFPNGEVRPLKPIFDRSVGKPIDNVGVFLQLATGRILDQRIAATVGARYDLQFFDYVDLGQPTQPVRHRSFEQLSPRLGLVAFPHSALALKGMFERAFRAPSPSELLTFNSLLAASNTEGLQPEQITTFTLAADLNPIRHLALRADWFYEKFANQIAFSATQNLVANLYSRTLTGVEVEALFDVPIRGSNRLGGFANVTGTRQLKEDVTEPTITPSERLTWAPQLVANAGIDVAFEQLGASLQAHYQDKVRRRLSDRFDLEQGTPTTASAFRGAHVDPWFTLDARISYCVTDGLRIGVQGTNLLNSHGHLVKPQNFPFDFQIPPARLLATVEITDRVSQRPAP